MQQTAAGSSGRASRVATETVPASTGGTSKGSRARTVSTTSRQAAQTLPGRTYGTTALMKLHGEAGEAPTTRLELDPAAALAGSGRAAE